MKANKQEMTDSDHAQSEPVRRRVVRLFSNEAGSFIQIMIELLLIALWALHITGPYLDMDPEIVPFGREYLSAIQTNHFWDMVRQCGWCAAWDGSTQGGSPALAQFYGSPFHPIVMVTTLGWGVVNGSKLALAVAFMLAGFAQWWLARELQLGAPARVWSGMMAVAAGNLAGRMELGLFGIVLSTGACALLLPALLRLRRFGGRRQAVILGVIVASVILAGQGYLQFGLILCLTALVFLLPKEPAMRRKFGLNLAGGVLLGVGLSAFFLLPMLRFLPEFGKPGSLDFETAQAFPYIPLNLVIHSRAFFYTDALEKIAGPFLHVNFIGWAPVLLAFYGLFAGGPDSAKVRRFLAVFALLAFWVSSAVPLRWLVANVPFEWIRSIAGVRFPSLIAGLAIAPLLGLAALGLDKILSFAWPKMSLTLQGSSEIGRGLSLSTRWLMVIPLVLALVQARSFGKEWIQTVRMDVQEIDAVLDQLETGTLQWVNPPFGEHFWVVAARERGMKLSIGIQPWEWRLHSPPVAYREATRGALPEQARLIGELNGALIFENLEAQPYASVIHEDGTRTDCRAWWQGGFIDVVCELPAAGRLVVLENDYEGWIAYDNGTRVPLEGERWIEMPLGSGAHDVRLRFRPWDVQLGLAISLLAIGVAVFVWFRGDGEKTPV